MLHVDCPDLEAALVSSAERSRLVRLCAHLSGSAEAAEDLAQETLLEAWRSRDRLLDPALQTQWLSGIARNVCRRWRRQVAATREAPGLSFENIEVQIAGDAVLDIHLERSEVTGLLDRALAMLPAGARELLVERYVEDLPVRELAARHGISEGAASVRLHRGKQALRQLLAGELREDATALGVAEQPVEMWQTTRIWCPLCGNARLQAWRDNVTGSFTARCPSCLQQTTEKSAAYLGEVKGYWRMLLRANQEADRYFRGALARGRASCACCGRVSPLRYSIPARISGHDRDVPGIHVRCLGCGAVSVQPDVGLALTLPAVQRFWREHKRVRLAQRQQVAGDGREAVLMRFEHVGGADAIDVLSDAGTFEVLHIACNGTEEARA